MELRPARPRRPRQEGLRRHVQARRAPHDPRQLSRASRLLLGQAPRRGRAAQRPQALHTGLIDLLVIGLCHHDTHLDDDGGVHRICNYQ